MSILWFLLYNFQSKTSWNWLLLLLFFNNERAYKGLLKNYTVVQFLSSRIYLENVNKCNFIMNGLFKRKNKLFADKLHYVRLSNKLAHMNFHLLFSYLSY